MKRSKTNNHQICNYEKLGHCCCCPWYEARRRELSVYTNARSDMHHSHVHLEVYTSRCTLRYEARPRELRTPRRKHVVALLCTFIVVNKFYYYYFIFVTLLIIFIVQCIFSIRNLNTFSSICLVVWLYLFTKWFEF